MIFIPKYGYIAAAYTTLAGYFLLMVLHYLSARFLLKKELYHNGRYFIMLFCTMAAAIGFTMLYDKWLPRYVLAAAVCGILAFIKKNDIIEFIDFLKKKRSR